MTPLQALARAPLAAYPVILAFVAVHSMAAGDIRGLVVSPFSALLMSLVAYPLALVSGWWVLRLWPALASAGWALSLGVGLVCAELAFWLLVRPWWHQEVYSTAFCTAMAAGCGLATAAVYRWLRAGTS